MSLNAPVIETTPVITSPKTPNLPTNSDKLGEINANMMGMKSFFMNEIYELKNEISLLRSLNDRNETKEPENSLTTTFWKRNSYFFRRNKKQLIRF